MKVLVNGRPGDAVSALDRGLAYGDGLFETLRVRAGRAAHWERHWARLARGCERLHLPLPSRAGLETEMASLLDGVERGVLRIQLTRGVGGRGYRPPTEARPTRILSVHPAPEYPAEYAGEGVSLRVCRTRLGLNPQLAGIKHLNRLEQVLARAEWADEVQEGLMLDARGRVVEGTMSNLFLLHDGGLLTPDLAEAGVAGITRERIFALAPRLGLTVEAVPLTLEAVYAAEGLFLCNSLIGIWPVRRVEAKDFRIPPMIRSLMAALAAEDGTDQTAVAVGPEA